MTMKTTLRRLLWRIAGRRLFNYRYLRRPDVLRCETAITEGESADDEALIDEVLASYRRSAQPAGESMWSDFYRQFHAEIDEAFRTNRARASQILRDPVTSDLFYGFDNLCRSLGSRLEDRRAPGQALDALIGFAEALGVRRMDNPEGYRLKAARIDPDEILASIDAAIGVALPVPNPYRGHYGVKTSRGVLTYRVPQAMYQAWRIRELAGTGARVLEIGGGLGFTALYARMLGIRDYTIVDIPITAAAQRYFLGRCGVPVRLQTPDEFHADSSRYDLIANIDSLTELDRSVAEGYVCAIKSRARIFLSINHESNAFTVRDLIQGSRHPYWMRRGYVEEICQFS